MPVLNIQYIFVKYIKSVLLTKIPNTFSHLLRFSEKDNCLKVYMILYTIKY